ncbi:hypothetical protein FN846DRAFT_966108 [Sphaerosporella brunnea]|uniref:Integral membrane protein n=1 Tax=Sphaerosporella brunnea TaxID=1250544 RepID=A0A5J5EM66_9PEZI|nr:hypothetical protein FN846DRAFT_966108 [Sphaerosporella brunnea]
MGDAFPPIPDYCWEGRLGTVIAMLCLLYMFMTLRLKAISGFTYSTFSPRGLSSACVMLATVLLTAYTCITIWNYTVWYRLRGLWQSSVMAATDEEANELLVVLRALIPQHRKTVCFIMRMLLVTVLWLVKGSFVLVYFEFRKELPRATRWLLFGITGLLVTSYFGIWIATGVEIETALNFEGYSPTAGAGVVLFTPPNTWSTWTVNNGVLKGKYNQGPTYLVVELIITSLNAGTDLMILGLIYSIFRHLRLAAGKGSFRAASLLIVLSVVSITIATIRLIIMLSGMRDINFRLAFDSLTEFEAFIAGCAACIPAMRVLARGAPKGSFGFAAGWATFGSRRSRNTYKSGCSSSDIDLEARPKSLDAGLDLSPPPSSDATPHRHSFPL